MSLGSVTRIPAAALWALAALVAWASSACDSLPRRWHGPELLGEASSWAYPKVGVDLGGSPLVVWRQRWPGEPGIRFARFIRQQGWSVPGYAAVTSGAQPLFRLAMNPRGEALVAWREGGAGYDDEVWAARFAPETGWRDAKKVADAPKGVSRLDVAVDRQGNALTVWTGSGLFTGRFVPSRGWEPIETLTEEARAGNPRVAFDDGGNALVVWDEFRADSLRGTGCGIRFDVQDGWGRPECFHAEDGRLHSPQAVLDRSGMALVVWGKQVGERDSLRSSVWANEFAPGLGWTPLDPVSLEPDRYTRPEIAGDGEGNTLAVWARDGDVWFSRFEGGRWDAARVVKRLGGPAASPIVAMDARGNAIAVWQEFVALSGHSVRDVVACRYLAGRGWEEPVALESDEGDAWNAQLAMSPTGDAVVVWDQDSDTGHARIFANRFSADED